MSLKNPFEPHIPRSKKTDEMIGKLLGEEARQEYLAIQSNTKESSSSEEPTDIILSKEEQQRIAQQEQQANPELSQEYKEMKELFKENFLGIEEVTHSFTLEDGTKLIDLTSTQKPELLKKLKEKLKEPDIAQFIERLKKKELDPSQFLFILRIGSFSDNTPITMKTLQERLEPDMEANGQGKLLCNQSWYHNEQFYTQPDPNLAQQGNMEWIIVTKDLLPDSLDKTHDQQTMILKQHARHLGLNEQDVRRRKPWEVVYDHVLLIRAKNQRIFNGEWKYDWTDTRTSDGRLVIVGNGNARGLNAFSWEADSSDGALGCSFSR